MTNLLTRQKGVTLLEVLVGFVIFTSSLVAVLDYVTGQIYHNHLSSTNLQKVQMVYDFSNAITMDPGAAQLPPQSNEHDNFEFTLSSATMDSSSQREGDLLLNRYDYSVSDNNNSFTWTVIKID